MSYFNNIVIPRLTDKYYVEYMGLHLVQGFQFFIFQELQTFSLASNLFDWKHRNMIATFISVVSVLSGIVWCFKFKELEYMHVWGQCLVCIKISKEKLNSWYDKQARIKIVHALNECKKCELNLHIMKILFRLRVGMETLTY